MTEKTKVPKAKVMASDKQWVTYTDEGGTLRRARASQVEVIEDGAASTGAPAATPQQESSAEEAVGNSASAADPEPSSEAPPSSDTPPVESAPAPTPPKAKRERKQTMATAQASTAAKKKAPPPKAKTAAKKAAPKPRTESSGIRTIGGKAVNLEGYEKVKSAAGGTSYHNGDAVAEKLAGKTLDEVFEIGAKTLKEDVKVLRKKYAHLNTGMQRMAIGNRMRKVLIPKEAKN